MTNTRQLVDDIERARAALLEALEAIGHERMATPIGEGRWSPTQYVEHLVYAEEVTLWRMTKAIDDSRRHGDVLVSPTPADTIEQVVERTWGERVEAPPLAVPKLGEPGAYWIARMRRNTTLVGDFAGMVREKELDQLAYPHPISGPFTLRQGLEFIRFHLDRHRLQLEKTVSGKS